jgi:hypothetical protein
MYVSPWMQSLVIPQRWNVCGVECRPLSLWHGYILRTAGNPFVCGGEPTLDAASEVLMYCSGGVTHGRRLYNGPHYRARHRRRVTRMIERKGAQVALAAVMEYTRECLRVPTHSISKGSTKGDSGSKPIAAPEAFVLAENLVRIGAVKSFDDALDYPYALAACIFDAGRNARGEDDSLVTEDRERKLDEMESEAAA